MKKRRLIALGLAVVAVAAGGGAAVAEREELPDPVVAAPSPVTPVLSARRVPSVLAAPVADRRLATAVDAVFVRQPGIACLTVASSGRTLYARNPDIALTPASVEKLVTATAALEVLGPDHRYRTTLVAAAPPVDGVVAGDLFLVGGGDPLLATAAYAARFRNQPQVFTPVESLADALAAAGVTRIDGRIVGDESRYDADRYPDAWPARFVDQDQSGPLSALTVNDAWVAFPPNADVRVPDETPAGDPAAHAAAVVTTLLAERGIAVAGAPASGPAPAGAVEVAAVESPPFSAILGEMLAESDNQTAELVLKELAVARGRPGTTLDGIAVAVELVGGSEVVDGSGLASDDRISCNRIQSLLDAAGPDSALAAGLPIAGQTGTLARRFLNSAVTGRLRAKTGTLNQVTALAGYLETTPGAGLTFSFIVNLPPELVVGVDDLVLQEELAATLARYPEGPSLDELGPQAVVVPDDEAEGAGG